MKTGDQDLSFVLNKALLRADDSLTSLETGLACIKLINLPYTAIKETEKVKFQALLTKRDLLALLVSTGFVQDQLSPEQFIPQK